jgi:RNA polymerase sigma-70 factor (ECF subfamily)
MKGFDHSSNRDADDLQADSTSLSLIDRIKHGDPDQWELLLRLYRPLVRWWCRGKGTRPEDTEDVVQEVFTNVLRTIGEFNKRPHRGAFRAWLKKITHYKLLEHWNQARNQAAAAGGSEAQEHLAAFPDPFGESSSADEDASERGILVRGVLELVRAEFEPNTWEAAQRTAVGGQPAAEVAAALGMTVAAVYIAKSRVLKRLRQALDELPD